MRRETSLDSNGHRQEVKRVKISKEANSFPYEALPFCPFPLKGKMAELRSFESQAFAFEILFEAPRLAGSRIARGKVRKK